MLTPRCDGSRALPRTRPLLVSPRFLVGPGMHTRAWSGLGGAPGRRDAPLGEPRQTATRSLAAFQIRSRASRAAAPSAGSRGHAPPRRVAVATCTTLSLQGAFGARGVRSPSTRRSAPYASVERGERASSCSDTRVSARHPALAQRRGRGADVRWRMVATCPFDNQLGTLRIAARDRVRAVEGRSRRRNPPARAGARSHARLGAQLRPALFSDVDIRPNQHHVAALAASCAAAVRRHRRPGQGPAADRHHNPHAIATVDEFLATTAWRSCFPGAATAENGSSFPTGWLRNPTYSGLLAHDGGLEFIKADRSVVVQNFVAVRVRRAGAVLLAQLPGLRGGCARLRAGFAHFALEHPTKARHLRRVARHLPGSRRLLEAVSGIALLALALKLAL